MSAPTVPTTVAVAAPKPRAQPTRVQLHMSVVLSILDHHARRNASTVSRSDRVVGTLWGVQSGGIVEITGSYAVPHVEKDKEVSLGKEFNSNMKALYAKTNPGEYVVGESSFFIAIKEVETDKLHAFRLVCHFNNS